MSFTMEGTGDLASDVYIRKSAYADAIDSEIVLGVIPEIVYKGSGNLESVTVNFAISDINIYDNYSSEDLKGAKRYNVFYYDKEEEFLVPLSTTVDESTNTIAATAPGAGTFVMIDMEKWFESLGFEITDEYLLSEANSSLGGNELTDVKSADEITDQRFLYDELESDGEHETISKNAEIQTIDESGIQEKELTDSGLISASQSTQTEETVVAPTERMMLMAAPAPIPSVITSGATVDLIFCINNNIYDINDTEFDSIKDNIKEISREVFAATGHARIYILDQNGNLILTKYSSKYALSDSSIDYMVSQIKNASPTVQNFDKQLETVINDIELRDGSYRSLVIFGDTYLSGQSETHATQLVNLGIKAIINCPYTQSGSWYDRLSIKSNGLLLYSYFDFADDVINFMFGDGYYSGFGAYNMITTNSLKKIKLKSILNLHNHEDTDKDGLKDWDEIKQSRITVDAGGNAILPTYYDYLNNFWFHEYLMWKLQYRKLYDKNGKSFEEMLQSILVLPVISDPSMADSDGDGMNDAVEFSNTYLDERFENVGPFHKDTVETLYPELEDQDSGKASYITVSDNDVVMHLRVVFKGDTDTKAATVLKTTSTDSDVTNEINAIWGRIGSDPTLKELAIDGIKSRWTTTFTGNQYDFCEELPVNFSVVIKDDTAEFFKNEITLNIKSGVCGVCHQAGVDWSAGCNRNVTMYTSYCKKHSDTDGSTCSDYTTNLYHIAKFAGTAAHEFGHVMGLKDLYKEASSNHGKEIVANTEITYQTSYFALPQAGVIMMNNGCATPNDVEMLIFAYAEDSWQYYVPYGDKQKMSKAIRSNVVFTDGTKNYTWDEANKKFI